MQDYFNLNAGRINSLLDFDDSDAAARRRGIFDIWWARDYDRYEQAIGRPGYFDLTNWPVSDQVSLYIRRDIAAQVWQYGIGGGTALNPLTEVQENICASNWQPLEASLVFDRSRSLMIRPTGIDVTNNGLVYVAEEGSTQTGANMRISVFDANGNYIESFGQRGDAASPGALFERPHSVEVGANGNIYVVDTWNYQIRVFNEEYEQINVWGQPFSFGIEAPREPVGGLWGPRDIAIDADGNVYISDTGNKRIRVYDAAGNYLRDIGTGGSGPGQLDEPTGVAVHPDGRVFIADTWNRRVAVFTNNGEFLYNFEVRGWAGEPINRPYIAIDAARDMVYVGDPDAGRVLVHNTAGDCLGSFGQLNIEAPGNGQFSAIGGIDVDADGFVYVTDIGTGRVLRFDPFPPPPPTANEGAESVDGANEDVPAAQEDVNNNNVVNQAESTVELSFPNDEDNNSSEETAETESTEETSTEDNAG